MKWWARSSPGYVLISFCATFLRSAECRGSGRRTSSTRRGETPLARSTILPPGWDSTPVTFATDPLRYLGIFLGSDSD
eukprot:1554776-Prymnesium_polylepis.1